jgi:thiol-disulfide isomerase/thioredoxin
MTIVRRLAFIAFILFSTLGFATTVFAQETAAGNAVDAYFFWGDGCPHCEKEETLLVRLEEAYPTLEIHRFEVFHDRENAALLQAVGKAIGQDVKGVPFLVIGNQAYSGYAEGVVDRAVEARVKECLSLPCKDLVGEIVAAAASGTEEPASGAPAEDVSGESESGTVRVPFFGEVHLSDMSLPVLSIVIGTLDGFNPCAMWVLVFLIGMLIGMKNRARMWTLGTAFIVASAAVYFLFMSAWLELILFLGFITIVRAIIGLVALGGGAYSLRDFFVNKNAECKVGDLNAKRKTMDRIKDVVQKRSFLLALVGIVALAFAVNLVELVCSAGFPAVFTQILTVNNLPRWQYYGYILLYLFFFMIDDLIVFVISMVTLQATGLTTKYTRASRLIGGTLMVAIGLLLLFRPEWLMFG